MFPNFRRASTVKIKFPTFHASFCQIYFPKGTRSPLETSFPKNSGSRIGPETTTMVASCSLTNRSRSGICEIGIHLEPIIGLIPARFQSSVPVAQANKWSGTCPDRFWLFEYNSSAKMRLVTRWNPCSSTRQSSLPDYRSTCFQPTPLPSTFRPVQICATSRILRSRIELL